VRAPRATATVWVDDWQHECCGEPFALGHEVRWLLTPDDAGRQALLHPEEGVIVTHALDSHRAGDEQPARAVVGRVTLIRAVQLEYQGQRVRRSVPGSARLTVLAESDGPETGWAGFVGYLVDLDVVAERA
jgi:hypothetical protein